METSIILSLLAGFAIGAVLIGFYFKSKPATILAGLQEKLNQQQSRIGSLESEKKILLSEKDSLIRQSTKAEAAVESLQIKAL